MRTQLVRLAASTLLVFTGLCWFEHAARAAEEARFDITQYGAIADGKTLNTQAIQSAIDACAAAGGGKIVVPKGEFISGSLMLKPKVNVELGEGAVLKNSPTLTDFAVEPDGRFEGHFAEHRLALLNGVGVDNLRITGPGTLDGSGAAYWDAKTPGGRPRLTYIRDSKNITVSGVRFWNSASWNLHFYNCQDVVVESSRFEIDDASKGPSTDGVDIDGSQNVIVRDCLFSVNDDCVCVKGNRYDGLDQTPLTTPSSKVRVTGCTFRRGMGALSLGTEATILRDIEMTDCTVTGNMPMLRIKQRPDTPGQDYQNVRVDNVKLDGSGVIVLFSLNHGTKVQAKPPQDQIRDVTISNITGKFGSFGKISNNANTDISDISLRNINVTLAKPDLIADGVTHLTLHNVVVNGTAVAATQPAGQ
ncbi:MAG: hypothetical protein JWM57_909 [Phycisphaerales bacterium]|nr:hypothetical protein [Phycisphaerales bacterium]